MKEKSKLMNRIIKFVIVYILICLTFVASYSFSRYAVTIYVNSYPFQIAKFNVTVNEQNIDSNIPLQVKLSSNSNTYNDKIAPDEQGKYFEIKIDPTGTEVNLEYELTFDLRNTAKNIQLIKYTVNDGQDLTITNNTIKGNIILSNKEKGFQQEDTINIKVYWEWNEEIINPVITNDDMNVTCIVKQKIN